MNVRFPPIADRRLFAVLQPRPYATVADGSFTSSIHPKSGDAVAFTSVKTVKSRAANARLSPDGLHVD